MLKLIASTLALTLAVPAAASNYIVSHQVVRFDDLNLSNPAGLKALERRIESAARRVCGDGETRAFVPRSRQVSECMTRARLGASQQVAAKTGASIRAG